MYKSSYKISLWYSKKIGKTCFEMAESLHEINKNDTILLIDFGNKFDIWDSLLRVEMNLLDTNVKDFVDFSSLNKKIK